MGFSVAKLGIRKRSVISGCDLLLILGAWFGVLAFDDFGFLGSPS
jgi:hypothetical protein